MDQKKDSQAFLLSKQTRPNFRRMPWLRLHITNLCNFDCPGCHVFKISENKIPATNMPYEIAEKAILFFSELMNKHFHGGKYIYLSIYGGEPLLNRPVLYKLLEKFGREHEGIKLYWVVNTNGSLLNREDLEKFAKNEVDIHMSVDGKEKKHNRARKDKLGNKTFQRVIKAIELIKQNNYPYLQFDSVANPYEINSINEVIDVAKDRGVSRVHLDFFYSTKYPDSFSAEEYGRAYARAYIYDRNIGVNVSESNFSDLYWNYWNDMGNVACSQSKFPFIHFFADGSFTFNELPLVKPFDYASNLDKSNIGNIWKRRVAMLLESEEEIKKKCRGCFLFGYCQGNTRRIYRYHTLSNKKEDNICAAARIAVMELAKHNFMPS